MQQGRDDELRPVAIDPQQVRRARLVGREIRYIGVMADEATGAERGGQIIQDLAIAGDHEHLSRRVGECRAAVEDQTPAVTEERVHAARATANACSGPGTRSGHARRNAPTPRRTAVRARGSAACESRDEGARPRDFA